MLGTMSRAPSHGPMPHGAGTPQPQMPPQAPPMFTRQPSMGAMMTDVNGFPPPSPMQPGTPKVEQQPHAGFQMGMGGGMGIGVGGGMGDPTAAAAADPFVMPTGSAPPPQPQPVQVREPSTPLSAGMPNGAQFVRPPSIVRAGSISGGPRQLASPLPGSIAAASAGGAAPGSISAPPGGRPPQQPMQTAVHHTPQPQPQQPQPPALPAGLNLDQRRTKVEDVPASEAAVRIPTISPDEAAQVKGWQRADEEWLQRRRLTQDRMHEELYAIGGAPRAVIEGFPGGSLGIPGALGKAWYEHDRKDGEQRRTTGAKWSIKWPRTQQEREREVRDRERAKLPRRREGLRMWVLFSPFFIPIVFSRISSFVLTFIFLDHGSCVPKMRTKESN
jgi:SWI/SNF-related matrix-associated actin-dependent regulator of chromatin subfamily B member 1